MSIAKKYGFAFKVAAPDSIAVQAFYQTWLKQHGLSLDIKPVSTNWVGVVRGDTIYAVFGWRVADAKAIEIADFYASTDRWGTLASYAALERIRDDARRMGKIVYTSTPWDNRRMRRAYKRVMTRAKPVLVVYKYDPADDKGVSP